MKRILALALVLTMALSLAACGQGNPPSTTPITTTPKTEESEPTTEPSETTTEPSAPGTEPSEVTTEPSETTTEPTETTTEPSAPETEPSEPKEGLLGRDSYSVSDDAVLAAGDTVVATMEGATLTVGQLQIYYWQSVYDFLNQYGYYAVYMGLDYTKPLDQQQCSQSNGTWQHYFLSEAINQWRSYQAMALLGQKAGMTLNADLQQELDGLYDGLLSYATEDGYSSVDDMLRSEMGPGCTYEDYYAYVYTYYLGYTYFLNTFEAEKSQITDKQLLDWFDENQQELEKDGITKDSGSSFDVRHILIQVAEGKTDADWAKCQADAQKLLDQWLAGEKTEDSFAALAAEHSADPGSKDKGGLYEGVNEDSGFVQPFMDWCLAEGRLVGDYGLVKTIYGYHIMYLSDVEPRWKTAAREGILEDITKEILETAATMPVEVFYENIVLGVVDLNQ